MNTGKIHRAAARTLIRLGELLVAAAPTAIAATILIPAAYASRGYAAVGGEWLAILLIFAATYTAAHKWTEKNYHEEE